MCGDMADWIIDNGILADLEEFGSIYYQKIKTCRYCGKGGLHWENAEGGKKYPNYRLFDDDLKLHNCREYFENG